MIATHLAFVLPSGTFHRVSNAPTRICSKYKSPNVRACAYGKQRIIPIIEVSMTEIGSILFPGGTTSIEVPLEDARRASESVNSQFGYISVDAWDEPIPIGTLAYVDEFSSKVSTNSALLTCTGIERFYTVSLDTNMAEISIFSDDLLDDYIHEDQRLVSTAEELIRLSKKTGDYSDAMMRMDKRLQWFHAITTYDSQPDTLPELWYRELSREKMREILSFNLLEQSASYSFMERRNLMEGVDYGERLDLMLNKLEPYMKEMSAKAAIASAFGDQLQN